MKRSEMVKVIKDSLVLNEIYNLGKEEASETMLRVLENHGMTPPKRYRSNDWNENNMSYAAWLQLPGDVNEWESEE